MNWFKLKKSDFPEGEPVLKMKRGLWYRPNNRGYTSSILSAGLYSREDALAYCFDGDRNGKHNVLAVPICEAIKHDGIDLETIAEYRDRLTVLEGIIVTWRLP